MHTGIWKVPQLSGDVRPPPCAGFTFNMIDTHRALMFGGRHATGRVSDVYIYDFHKSVRSNYIDLY